MDKMTLINGNIIYYTLTSLTAFIALLIVGTPIVVGIIYWRRRRRND